MKKASTLIRALMKQNQCFTVLTVDVIIHVVKQGSSRRSEPELGDKDMDVDDVLAGVTLGYQVAHGQFQHRSQWTNQRLHLANNTWMGQGRTTLSATQ